MLLSCLRPAATHLRLHSARRWISDSRAFAPNDRVLLRQTRDRSAPPILTRPLKPGRRIEGHRGVIWHDDIIGKRARDVVRSATTKSLRTGTEYMLQEVTLEDYARLSRRLVTPIYGADANLIVSLLDLHPDNGAEESEQKLEILEAGTGHGALTLYLSRAIHAANSRRPTINDMDAMEEWKANRQAILHTIDVSSKFSEHAQEVVRGFRHGQYADNVEFHVGDVSGWLKETLSTRGHDSFLSHAFLDLPAADDHLETVTRALRVDGRLIVFNPSITQITTCAMRIKEERIPLDLDKVVELGVNGGSGGREWDVRFVRPRSQGKAAEGDEAMSAGREALKDHDDEPAAVDDESLQEPTSPWSLICRPKVGERIVGGGFLGVWKKKPQRS